jgi:hypothetical protein
MMILDFWIFLDYSIIHNLADSNRYRTIDGENRSEATMPFYGLTEKNSIFSVLEFQSAKRLTETPEQQK